MSTGLKANSDGSAAIQVGGVDAITLTSAGAASFVTSPMTIQGGSAAAPSLTFSGDTNTGIFSPAADTIAFSEGGVESMRIDASGNLGLGVTPSAFGIKALQVAPIAAIGSAGAISSFSSNVFWTGAYSGQTYIANGFSTAYLQNAGSHAWYNAPSGTAGNAITFTQAMTLDSSGNLLVGTTSLQSGGTLSVVATSGNGAATFRVDTNSANTGRSWVATTSGTRFHFAFGDGSSFTERGVISTNGSTTTYGTGSDYRLKENVQTMSGALARVAQMRPVTWTWKESQVSGEGFIAHELQAVVPDAVVGEKDAIDENGKPIYQNVDASFVVATLTAAIQEQQQMIETLQAKVAALEAK